MQAQQGNAFSLDFEPPARLGWTHLEIIPATSPTPLYSTDKVCRQLSKCVVVSYGATNEISIPPTIIQSAYICTSQFLRDADFNTNCRFMEHHYIVPLESWLFKALTISQPCSFSSLLPLPFPLNRHIGFDGCLLVTLTRRRAV